MCMAEDNDKIGSLDTVVMYRNYILLTLSHRKDRVKQKNFNFLIFSSIFRNKQDFGKGRFI